MRTPISFRWAALVTTNALLGCMLCLQQPTTAAPAVQPFANAVEQRIEMIEQLKQMNALLKEQNTLLRSGTVKVIVQEAR